MPPELDGQESEEPKERNSIIEAFILAVGGTHVAEICRKKASKRQVNTETTHPYLGVGERFFAQEANEISKKDHKHEWN